MRSTDKVVDRSSSIWDIDRSSIMKETIFSPGGPPSYTLEDSVECGVVTAGLINDCLSLRHLSPADVKKGIVRDPLMWVKVWMRINDKCYAYLVRCKFIIVQQPRSFGILSVSDDLENVLKSSPRWPRIFIQPMLKWGPCLSGG